MSSVSKSTLPVQWSFRKGFSPDRRSVYEVMWSDIFTDLSCVGKLERLLLRERYCFDMKCISDRFYRRRHQIESAKVITGCKCFQIPRVYPDIRASNLSDCREKRYLIQVFCFNQCCKRSTYTRRHLRANSSRNRSGEAGSRMHKVSQSMR